MRSTDPRHCALPSDCRHSIEYEYILILVTGISIELMLTTLVDVRSSRMIYTIALLAILIGSCCIELVTLVVHVALTIRIAIAFALNSKTIFILILVLVYFYDRIRCLL